MASRRYITPRRVVNALAIVLGILLLVVAYDRHQQGADFSYDVAKDIGILIGGLAIIDLFWGFVGGDPTSHRLGAIEKALDALGKATDAEKDLERQGISRVGTRKTLSLDLGALFDEARHAVDLSGYTLYTLVENPTLLRTLSEKARAGIPVRLLVMDPANPSLEQSPLAKHVTTMRQQMVATAHAAMEHQGIEIHTLKKAALSSSVVRVDETMLVTSYLRSVPTAESPAIQVVARSDPARGLFATYKQEFETLWALSDPLTTDPARGPEKVA